MSRFGWTASIGPGAIAMTYPIQLFPLSVAPICDPFMKVTRWTGEDGERQSMISRKYGVREVRHCPGSADDTGRTIFSLLPPRTDPPWAPAPSIGRDLMAPVGELLPQRGVDPRAVVLSGEDRVHSVGDDQDHVPQLPAKGKRRPAALLGFVDGSDTLLVIYLRDIGLCSRKPFLRGDHPALLLVDPPPRDPAFRPVLPEFNEPVDAGYERIPPLARPGHSLLNELLDAPRRDVENLPQPVDIDFGNRGITHSSAPHAGQVAIPFPLSRSGGGASPKMLFISSPLKPTSCINSSSIAASRSSSHSPRFLFSRRFASRYSASDSLRFGTRISMVSFPRPNSLRMFTR